MTKGYGEVQMGKIVIEKLDHDVLDQDFDCGNSSINRQIQESYFPTLLQYCYAYQVSISGCVVGYYMIKMRTVNMEKVPEKLSEYTCSLVNSCSAVHISYIAVDKRYQNRKIGTYILKTIVNQVLKMCQQFPITIITLDALKEKYEWYKDRGFIAFSESDLTAPGVTIPMYVSCILNQEAVDNYCDV